MPLVFEPNSALTALTGGRPQVWTAVSGGPSWGGAVVLISFDGTNYSYFGTLSGSTQQGLTYEDFPAYSGGHGGADTTDTLAVDLTMSISNGGLPSNATNADADQYLTLCYLTTAPSTWSTDGDGNVIMPTTGELIAYGAVAQGGTANQFLLGHSSTYPSAYIRRGLYGTSSPDWPSGSYFTRINLNEQGAFGNSLLINDLPTSYIGQPIYLKFLSFNVFGNSLQDPSDVVAYKYTPAGTGSGGGSGGVPTAPTGFSANGVAGGIALSWNANPSTDNVTSYTVLRATSSGGPYSAIWTGDALAITDTNVVIGTTYDYEVEATNAAGTSSAAGPVSAVASPGASAGRTITVASGISSVSLLPSDTWVGILNENNAALTINLPSSPVANQSLVVQDMSVAYGGTGYYSAAQQNWTVKAASTTVDTVVVAGGTSEVHWDGNYWAASP
jgi:hypothetical protein